MLPERARLIGSADRARANAVRAVRRSARVGDITPNIARHHFPYMVKNKRCVNCGLYAAGGVINGSSVCFS